MYAFVAPSLVYQINILTLKQSVALNAVVAAARQQGSIVLYLPNCEYLRKFGKYTEPSPSHPDMFDLPVHAKSFLKQLGMAHGEQLATLKLTKESNINTLPEEYRSFNLQQLVQVILFLLDAGMLFLREYLFLTFDHFILAPRIVWRR